MDLYVKAFELKEVTNREHLESKFHRKLSGLESAFLKNWVKAISEKPNIKEDESFVRALKIIRNWDDLVDRSPSIFIRRGEESFQFYELSISKLGERWNCYYSSGTGRNSPQIEQEIIEGFLLKFIRFIAGYTWG